MSGARTQLASAPAGAGKTTAMRALTLAWAQDGGQVIGLGGLGRYLIDGIALGDYPQTAGGAVLVAVLAVGSNGKVALKGLEADGKRIAEEPLL